jgi:hypothetical protein
MAYGINMASGVDTLKWSESGVSHIVDPGDHNLHDTHKDRLVRMKAVYGKLKKLKIKEQELVHELKSVYKRIKTDGVNSEGMREATKEIDRVTEALLTATTMIADTGTIEALRDELSVARTQLADEEYLSLPEGWDYNPREWYPDKLEARDSEEAELLRRQDAGDLTPEEAVAIRGRNERLDEIARGRKALNGEEAGLLRGLDTGDRGGRLDEIAREREALLKESAAPDWLMWKPTRLFTEGRNLGRVIWKYWGQDYNDCGKIEKASTGVEMYFERFSRSSNPLQSALVDWYEKGELADRGAHPDDRAAYGDVAGDFFVPDDSDEEAAMEEPPDITA